MLTKFDTELYPDDCKVVEMPPYNQNVFLIQKNASSSLLKQADVSNFRVLKNQQLASLSTVDIYIRDPLERYISGLNTYVQFTLRDNPSLDPNTVKWFASTYNFLNRHYLPQFLWIVNLSRFISAECKINLRNLSSISDITEYNRKPGGVEELDEQTVSTIKQSISPDLELWLFIDQQLKDMCGNSYTFAQLISNLQSHPSNTYNILTQRFASIAKTILS